MSIAFSPQSVSTADVRQPPGLDALLLAAADRDTQAYSALYEHLHAPVVAAVLRVLRDHAMAEEVAQEVLLEVWEKAARFDPSKGSARAWVMTLARRRAVDRVRSEQASRNRDDRVARQGAQIDIDNVAEEVEARLDRWQVRQALDALTLRQREAIELAYYAGHTYRDVANVLSIPEGTAKSRLRDGLQRLREELEGLV